MREKGWIGKGRVVYAWIGKKEREGEGEGGEEEVKVNGSH